MLDVSLSDELGITWPLGAPRLRKRGGGGLLWGVAMYGGALIPLGELLWGVMSGGEG